jgi:uncharacterized protein (TIGR00251 family)
LPALRIDPIEGGVRLRLLVVPGASRAQIVGVHDDALRIRVAAPPEKGKANAAVCLHLAKVLGVRKADVRIAAGHGARQKRVEILGLDASTVRSRLGI